MFFTLTTGIRLINEPLFKNVTGDNSADMLSIVTDTILLNIQSVVNPSIFAYVSAKLVDTDINRGSSTSDRTVLDITFELEPSSMLPNPGDVSFGPHPQSKPLKCSEIILNINARTFAGVAVPVQCVELDVTSYVTKGVVDSDVEEHRRNIAGYVATKKLATIAAAATAFEVCTGAVETFKYAYANKAREEMEQ